MRLQRLWLVGLAVAALAGCGESSSSGDGSADPAQAIPAGVPVYVEGSVRPQGDQGDSASALVEKFLPPGTTLTGLIDEQIKEEGGSYDKDVKPWLGERVGIGVANLAAENPTYYGAVATKDADKASAFLGQEGKDEGEYSGAEVFSDEDDTWAAVKDDYVVFADTEADLKKAVDAAGGDSLGETQVFEDAVDELPDVDERLGALFVDMKQLGDVLESAPGIDPAGKAVLEQFLGEGDLEPITAALSVTPDSATIESRFSGGGLARLTSFGLLGTGTSTDLIQDAPADAFAVFGAPDVGASLKATLAAFAGAFGGAALTGQLESQTGINLDRDLFSWIGDIAVFARGDSLSTINGGVVIEATDEDAARAALPRLVAAAKRMGAPVARARVDGADQAYSVPAPGAPGPVVLAGGNGRVVLAFGEDAAAEALAPGGDTFADSAAYTNAKDAVDGLEPSLVLSLPAVLELAGEAGAASDPDFQEAKPYLDRLDLVVTGSEKDGDTLRSLFTITTE